MKFQNQFIFSLMLFLCGCAGLAGNWFSSSQNALDNTPKVNPRLANVKKIFIDRVPEYTEQRAELVQWWLQAKSFEQAVNAAEGYALKSSAWIPEAQERFRLNMLTTKAEILDPALRDTNEIFRLPKGWSEIVVHGTRDGSSFASTRGNEIFRKSEQEVLDTARRFGESGCGPLLLMSCHAGKNHPGLDALAQRSANLGDRPVVAATTKVGIDFLYSPPTLFEKRIADPDGPIPIPQGRWKAFFPK